MQVLAEQHVSSRRSHPRHRRPRRTRTGATSRASSRAAAGEHLARSLSAFRTAALTLLTIALGAALVVIVPELEEAAARTAGDEPADAAIQAAISPFTTPPAGLVEFEQTDDIEYFVEEGETLSAIARKHRIDYRLLADYNALANPHALSVGQRITIPGTTSRLLLRE